MIIVTACVMFVFLSVKSLERVVFELMIAGIETTASGFLWFSLYMLHNPQVQRKVGHKELEIKGLHIIILVHYLNILKNSRQIKNIWIQIQIIQRSL